MKVQVVGLDWDDIGDQELFGKFQKFLKEQGPEGLADVFGLDTGPGAELLITRQMLEKEFGSRKVSLDSFLAKYAHPDDLAPYRRVAGLVELYDMFYKPRLP